MEQYTPTTLARFWRKVRRTEDCWEWQGCLNRQNYGKFHSRPVLWLAHRFAYTIAHGPIPTGLCVLHRCDNPRCVRPDHLFLGSIADNNADMAAKGRRGISGFVRVPRKQTGTDNHMAKLTDEVVRDIRARYASGGASLSTLAREYGCSPNTISRAIHRVSWKHV